MGEPLVRDDPAETPVGDGPLADASMRLGRALARLEASLQHLVADAAGVTPPEALADLAAELKAARDRERALQSAAADASQALERAMTEVRQVLREDEAASRQGELDFALETEGALADDEPDAAAQAPQEDPTR